MAVRVDDPAMRAKQLDEIADIAGDNAGCDREGQFVE